MAGGRVNLKPCLVLGDSHDREPDLLVEPAKEKIEQN